MSVIRIAPVRKSLVVEATPQRAFEVFTAHMDRWWPKTHNIGSAPIKSCLVEPFVGGRWYNECVDGSQATVGHVRVWQPGERLVVSWEISAQWKPDAREHLASEVEVRFLPESGGRTRVELEHRDFERMEEGTGKTMRDAVDNGWPGVLTLFAEEVARRPQAML